MSYSVKELFYTLQGEGAQSGRAAVFCRFTGCNLWNGLEKDRQQSACPFCDTDFVGTNGEGGGKFADADILTCQIVSKWPDNSAGKPYVVFTGGEPLLQLNTALIKRLHQQGFEIGVETNGTIAAPDGIDWLCVSPKTLAELRQQHGQEIKLLYPLKDMEPEKFSRLDFDFYYLQPVADANSEENTRATVQYCLDHPQWRVSLQTHKILNLK